MKGGTIARIRRWRVRALIARSCALVIVEHDLDFIKDICDHLTVLDQDRVLDDGTVAEIEHSAKA